MLQRQHRDMSLHSVAVTMTETNVIRGRKDEITTRQFDASRILTLTRDKANFILALTKVSNEKKLEEKSCVSSGARHGRLVTV